MQATLSLEQPPQAQTTCHLENAVRFKGKPLGSGNWLEQEGHICIRIDFTSNLAALRRRNRGDVDIRRQFLDLH
ncbi:unnamed protein product [Microthlaspi erraticum]|uniref:Uncharacterized protein n=1 Tax=Microthlaspi erraticum TaxID=1685480 RepID=A0A6D2JLS3_9BRAS|nr:unnamed protein product [Microthlaspi erraticum]